MFAALYRTFLYVCQIAVGHWLRADCKKRHSMVESS